jgi:Mor family transcriptional regulator
METEIERAEKEHFNGIYKELLELIGYENTIILHQYYAGQYITFPKRLLKESYLHQSIVDEYDGTNARELARKYDYSYSWIMKILKKSKNDD